MNRKGIPLLEELTVDTLISAFYHSFAEDFAYEGEQHPGWEFVYVEQGNIEVQAGKDTYILKSGEMVCHQPMEFHCLRPYRGPASAIILCFTCHGTRIDWFRNKILTLSSRQKQYLNDIAVTAEKLLEPKAPLDIVRDGVMDRAKDGTTAQEQIIKNTLELLALSLLSSESTERRERVERYEQYLHRHGLTAEIQEYLQENLQKSIRLEDISSRFSYSLSSIRRIFREETGTTIMAYLTDLRMEKAKMLLTNSDLTVDDIASATGYSSLYYFSNAFKAHTGKSPSQYRKE